jgi:hypothetical protein
MTGKRIVVWFLSDTIDSELPDAKDEPIGRHANIWNSLVHKGEA